VPRALDVSALPALQGANGPVGGTLGFAVGLADEEEVGAEEGEAETVGDGLVVSDGLGVGAAIAGLANSANAKEPAAVRPTEILR
jgi:hypothetical protein